MVKQRRLTDLARLRRRRGPMRYISETLEQFLLRFARRDRNGTLPVQPLWKTAELAVNRISEFWMESPIAAYVGRIEVTHILRFVLFMAVFLLAWISLQP